MSTAPAASAMDENAASSARRAGAATGVGHDDVHPPAIGEEQPTRAAGWSGRLREGRDIAETAEPRKVRPEFVRGARLPTTTTSRSDQASTRSGSSAVEPITMTSSIRRQAAIARRSETVLCCHGQMEHRAPLPVMFIGHLVTSCCPSVTGRRKTDTGFAHVSRDVHGGKTPRRRRAIGCCRRTTRSGPHAGGEADGSHDPTCPAVTLRRSVRRTD